VQIGIAYSFGKDCVLSAELNPGKVSNEKNIRIRNDSDDDNDDAMFLI
jgi:hypothetical protein